MDLLRIAKDFLSKISTIAGSKCAIEVPSHDDRKRFPCTGTPVALCRDCKAPMCLNHMALRVNIIPPEPACPACLMAGWE